MPRTAAQLGQEQDPFGKQAIQSLALHAAIVCSIVGYAIVQRHLHGNAWGNNSLTQGAIQATMVSSAPAIPLPPDEQKPSDRVLATETPSPAPAPPAPKAPPAEEEKTVPIPVKQPVKARLQPKKAPEQPSPVKEAKPSPQAAPKHVQLIKPQDRDRANYGEAAAAMPRSMAPATPAAQVNVQGGDFGSRFAWYVDVIKRKTATNWYLQEVDPSTPGGAKVNLTFTVGRDGSPSQVRIARSSGSPTLDASCVRAVRRVETYGPLPSGYTGSSLQVDYYCAEPDR